MFDTLTRGGASGAGGTYEIDRSLRFNSGDNAGLSRTFGTVDATNNKNWTISLWTKRSKVGVFSPLFGYGTAASGSSFGGFYFAADDTIHLFDQGNSLYKISQMVFRDTSAWYHIVVAVDADAGTPVSKAWINGVELTYTGQNTQPSNATGHAFTSSAAHYIGTDSAGYDYDGYIAEMHICTGLYLDHEDFGKTDPDTGAWVPIKYTGGHGDHGSYLNFSDNSNTTSGTLGADSSANSNDWTPNNFSVASGEGNDSVTDTPTNNYCTWNPLDWIWGGFSGHQADDRLRNGNLSTVNGSNKNLFMKGTFFMESGKWYYEAKGVGHGSDKIGWARSEDHVGSEGSTGEHTTHHAYLAGNGDFQSNATTATPYGGTTYGGAVADGDVIGCAIDLDNNTVAYHNGGQWGDGSGNWDETYDNANKISISNYGTGGGWAPAYADSGTSHGGDMHANFGQQGFAHTPPTGFKALSTANLPEPTIKKASDYVKATAYTGNATDNRSLTVGFQPNLTILKQRDYTKNWYWYDSIRGANEQLISNGTNAEAEIADRMQAFESNGIQIGASSEINNNNSTYVNYSWKESASAGFDIVAYDGNGSARTISHGCGAIPRVIIVKRLDADVHWKVYYALETGLGAGVRYMDLYGDAASVYNATSLWNGTTATSSVFSIGDSNDVNHSSGNFIAYLWAPIDGYSIFKPYRGNGGSGSHGEFVWTGFEPQIVIIKNMSATGPWNIFDNARESFNPMDKNLRLNTAGQEDSARYIDFLSNGFMMRNSGSESNTDNSDYLVMAFAKTPFKYANAR